MQVAIAYAKQLQEQLAAAQAQLNNQSDDDVNINIEVDGASQGQTQNMGHEQTASGSAEENGGQEKIEICHDGQTIEVAASALPAHYGHGDTLGPCLDEEVVSDETVDDTTDSALSERVQDIPGGSVGGSGNAKPVYGLWDADAAREAGYEVV